jgi:peptide maturation system acyl carrier-related protein
MNDNMVTPKLMDLFNTYFQIDFIKNENLLLKNLLSEEIGMAPRDLVCLFFYIEEEFKITIPEDSIANEEFAYFNSILQIIEKQLHENNLLSINSI